MGSWKLFNFYSLLLFPIFQYVEPDAWENNFLQFRNKIYHLDQWVESQMYPSIGSVCDVTLTNSSFCGLISFFSSYQEKTLIFGKHSQIPGLVCRTDIFIICWKACRFAKFCSILLSRSTNEVLFGKHELNLRIILAKQWFNRLTV